MVVVVVVNYIYLVVEIRHLRLETGAAGANVSRFLWYKIQFL